MAHIRKLNNIINEFEKETKNIHSISGLVNKIKELQQKIEENEKNQMYYLKNLNEAKQELQVLISRNNKLEAEMLNAIKRVHDFNVSISNEITTKLQNAEAEFLNQLQGIRNENKKAYLNFEEILTLVSDKNKMDLEIKTQEQNTR
ncbi:hypothetical protein [Desulfofalx alkaliphila]|uniref:hypothetical protein n=1 Tax=Desulfofalx alkaliphila TaxID=105483 RepID=UPI0004E19F8C|nr:hypothetical protein [Desulfofalx alkaliphila]